MKKAVLVLCLLSSQLASLAQSPAMINYQGVLRKDNGFPEANHRIGLKFLIANSATAIVGLYEEERKATTNSVGAFAVKVGDPSERDSYKGFIDSINWAGFPSAGSGAKYLIIKVDVTGGTRYTDLAAVQLVSVPYAMSAKAAYPVGLSGGDLTGTYPKPQIYFPLKKSFNFRDTALIEMTNLSPSSQRGAIWASSASIDANASALTGTLTSITTNGLSAGVRGINNAINNTGAGVYGSQAGSGYGMYGVTPNGIGVYGTTTGPNSFAIKGESTNGVGVHGASISNISGFFENKSNSNIAPTISVATNGVGVAINAANSGSGGAGILQIANPTNASEALSVRTAGIGKAVLIETNNAGNTKTSLEVQNKGVGSAIWLENTAVNTNPEMSIKNNGSSQAAFIESLSPTNSNPIIELQDYGLGSGLLIQNNNQNNLSSIFRTRSNGTGRSLLVESINNSNSSNVMEIHNEGLGAVALLENVNSANNANIVGIRTNGIIRGAYIENTNPNNLSNAFQVTNNGAGATAFIENINSGNNASNFIARSNGLGRDVLVQNTNTINAANVLEVQTNGTGTSSYIENTNSNNNSSTVLIRTNGKGAGLHLEATNAASNANGMELFAFGNGRAALFQLSNSLATSNVIEVNTNSLGNAGVFGLNNISNPNNALKAVSNGTGYAAHFQNTGSLGRGLKVDGSTLLNGALVINGKTTINDSIIFNGPQIINDATQSTSPGSGSLIVKGGVGIAKNLNVGGNTIFDNHFTVKGTSDMFGPAFVFNSFTVQKNAPSDEVATFNNTADGNGIGIRINTPNSSTSNNYVTFRNGNFETVGRIEGETLGEAVLDFDYLTKHIIMARDIGETTDEAVAAFSELDIPEGIINGLYAISATVELATYESDKLARHGVTYESGNGDYAEWLKKKDRGENFSFGDVVSVRNGVITKNTTEGGQCMVVSMKPIVLGNMPEKGLENDYQKIAFMGQVPVKVIGLVDSGDVILPSGRNDGTAIAIPKSQLRSSQFKQVIGIAWSSGYASSGFSFINTAVGINQDFFADKIEQQEEELTKTRGRLVRIEQYLAEKDASFKAPPVIYFKPDTINTSNPVEYIPDLSKKYGHQVKYSKAWLQKNKKALTAILAEIKVGLELKHFDFDKNPKVRRLVTDVDYFFFFFFFFFFIFSIYFFNSN